VQLEKKIYCHWDLVRFITEDHLKKDGSFRTMSVTHTIQKKNKETVSYEMMIFLGKSDSGNEYEVRVYKSKPDDKYVPKEQDKVKRYEENDEFATFYFNDFEKAHEFVDCLDYRHPEYKARPMEVIEPKK